MENIEVEVRSFLTEKKYNDLLAYFKENCPSFKEDYQETFYFDCVQDLRIQKNDYFAKIWMKQGRLHDDHREELEIKVPKEDFEKLEQLFLSLGYTVEIKWFRKRFEFLWDDITVCIDYTRGHGYIVELEKMSTEDDKEKVHKALVEKLQSLGVVISTKEEFKRKYEEYKQNWRELINDTPSQSQ